MGFWFAAFWGLGFWGGFGEVLFFFGGGGVWDSRFPGSGIRILGSWSLGLV